MQTQTRIRIKWKGVRNSSMISKAKSEADVWDMVFNPEYKFPKCEVCNTPMDMEYMEIHSDCRNYYPVPSIHVTQLAGPETIHINLKCPECGTLMECVALGIKWDFDNMSFTVENLEPIRMQTNMRKS